MTVAKISFIQLIPAIILIALSGLACKAMENTEEIHYLEFLGDQIQMESKFQSNDNSEYYSNKYVILVSYADKNDEIKEQYFISNESFVVVDKLNQQILRPQFIFGNYYGLQIITDDKDDFKYLQGGALFTGEEETLLNIISSYYGCEIYPLVYDDNDLSDTGSTNIDSEHAAEIEPIDIVEDDIIDVEPVEDPEDTENQNTILDEGNDTQIVDDVSIEDPEEVQSKEDNNVADIKLEEEDKSIEKKKKNSEDDIKSDDNDNKSSSIASDTYVGKFSTNNTPKNTYLRSNNVEASAESSTINNNENTETSSTATTGEVANISNTAIDGEEVVDDTTLHNDNVLLQVALWTIGGLAVSMGIIRFLL